MSQITDTSSLSKRITGYVRRAWAQLYWERYAPIFAVAAAILAVFLIGAFGGVWERIGDPWRLILLVIAVGFLIRAGLRAQKTARPNLSAARRRVENDSDVKHRPLDVLDDSPAISEDVWPLHYKTAKSSAETLKPAKWRHVLGPIDPYYMRYILPCAVGLSMMVGFGDNTERLRRALTPSWQSAINAADVKFEAWVDPPEYTGRPPLYFKDKKNIDVPAGSELVARISGAKNAPRLKLSTSRGGKYLKLKRLGPKSFEARTILKTKSTARWRIGSTQKKWALNVLPDTPPTLVLNSEIKADKRDRLAFTYSFEDDYGVERLELSMRLLRDDIDTSQTDSRVTVPLSSGSVKRAEETEAALDLTKHEWAGQKVSGRLIATDGMGQSTSSEDVFFTVPDKIFIEPLAKAIIEQRGLVIEGQKEYASLPPTIDPRIAPTFDTYEPEYRMNRAPDSIERAALLIDIVTDKPAGLFQDPAIFMGLRNVYSRLRYADEQDDLRGIPQDLWAIAIRAEFGVLGTALEEMREAKAALQDGMARRAPEREIDTLFERYDEAVERYMEELRRKAIEDGNIQDADGGGEGGGGRNADEIEALLKAIEEANRIGDVEGARKALAQLAELLENMEIQLTRGGSGGEGGEDSLPGEMSEEMKKSLEELADLMGEQRELQDETRQAENEAENEGNEEGGEQGGEQSGNSDGGNSQEGEGTLSPSELAKRQGALEKALEALSQALPEEGETGQSLLSEDGEGKAAGSEESETGEGGGGEEDPESENKGGGGDEDGDTQSAAEALAEAGEAMRRSQDNLQAGDIPSAGEAQNEAIKALRRAGQAMAESGRESGNGKGEGGTEEAENDDPLGRDNSGGNADESEADIDTRDNATRSRELREELRRRSSEQEREKIEREYLERLLKRF